MTMEYQAIYDGVREGLEGLRRAPRVVAVVDSSMLCWCFPMVCIVGLPRGIPTGGVCPPIRLVNTFFDFPTVCSTPWLSCGQALPREVCWTGDTRVWALVG